MILFYFVVLQNYSGIKYDAEFLKEINAEGVKAVSMRPCYPSLTFPNLCLQQTNKF